MNQMPLQDEDTSELDAYLAELDRALDACFMADMNEAFQAAGATAADDDAAISAA
ncbi:MAG: hypothetical protein QM767_16945 [Anaeromyxobacter sp.]